ncbi:unnamed protein product [Linum trigynum]|uniref:Peptidase S74 domain-containing protein n=1 Tax=Linum trigynum TaxID=586398 RepID=A0AAV2GQH0_9ROSI
MSRFVLDSNNLWLVGNSDGTISVLDGPDVADVNPKDVTGDVSQWQQTARIGTNTASTHQELEVFGVVFSGQKLEELRKNTYDDQVTVTREGFMIQWLNPSGGDKGPKEGNPYRRLNDLFDWSKHGVEVPTPVATEWDRYQLGTGELMAEGSGLVNLAKVIEELEMENQTLRDEKDLEISELNKKLAEGKGGGGGDDNKSAADKDKEIAVKDEQIRVLKEALKLFL